MHALLDGCPALLYQPCAQQFAPPMITQLQCHEMNKPKTAVNIEHDRLGDLQLQRHRLSC